MTTSIIGCEVSVASAATGEVADYSVSCVVSIVSEATRGIAESSKVL